MSETGAHLSHSNFMFEFNTVDCAPIKGHYFSSSWSCLWNSKPNYSPYIVTSFSSVVRGTGQFLIVLVLVMSGTTIIMLNKS